MSLSERKKKRLLIVIAIVTTSSLYLNFFIRPNFVKLMELNSREATIKSGMLTMQNEIKFIDEYSKKLDVLKSENRDLKKRLSDSKDIPTLITEFSKIARELDVKLTSIKPLPAPVVAQGEGNTRRPYVNIPIEIEAISGFHQMGAFINKLENLDVFLKITSLDIKESEDTPFTHTIRFKLAAFASSEEAK